MVGLGCHDSGMATRGDWPDAGPDAWYALSARLQRLVAHRSGRTDVVVRIAPAEPGSSTWLGGYRHDIAEVLLDARALLDSPGDDPAAIDPLSAAGRSDHAALVGACCTAAAHAAHTRGDLGEQIPGAVAAIARQLERARACARHLDGHPADRLWIRASLEPEGAASNIDAVGLLALSGAGVLAWNETAPLRDHLAGRLEPGQLAELEDDIHRSLALADGDLPELLACARSIATRLDLNPSSSPAQDEHPDDDDAAGAAAARVAGSVAADARRLSERRLHRTPGPSRDEADDALRANARAAATQAFGGRQAGASTLREPDATLRRDARELAASIRRARYRAPHVLTVASALPPGRMRLAEAMRREAQQAAGAAVTARPWLQSRRREAEQPPLRVGLSWDTSRSRMAFHSRMADLAWALSWAMAHSTGTMAAVSWNSQAAPVAWPGRVPREVVEPRCQGGSSACPQSIRALDGALGLRDADGARLLVVTTDLDIANRRLVDDEVRDLARRGVRVLWVTDRPDPRTPPGATNIVPADDERLIHDLGTAICSTLRGTS